MKTMFGRSAALAVAATNRLSSVRRIAAPGMGHGGIVGESRLRNKLSSLNAFLGTAPLRAPRPAPPTGAALPRSEPAATAGNPRGRHHRATENVAERE